MSSAAQSHTTIELLRIEPTWRMALRIWWSWQWRTILVSVGIGLLLDVWTKFWFGGLNPDVRVAIAYVMWVAVGVYFFKDLLQRNFKKFRVLLVPSQDDDPSGADRSAD